jgi:hyperosmotically inducible periplasmic protein
MNARKLLTIVMMTGISLPALAQVNTTTGEGRYDEQIHSQVIEQLQKKEKLRAITADVEDGIVTLSGEVGLYIDKVDAEKRVRKIRNVDGVRNHVIVAGDEIEDAELREKLANKLRYDRVGYGIVFNNLNVRVENGAVLVEGKVRDYPDRDSAIAIIQTTPGVKDVIDEIDVAPLSGFDDELRIRLARAIYGSSSLQKYALDPQAPIRIIVENGHVQLAGVVLNEMDRQLAHSQANSVPGVFSVTNNLVVASNIDR